LEVVVGVVVAIVGMLLLLLEVALFARAAVDWSAVLVGPSVPGSVRGRLTGVLHAVTEPVLAPVRRVVPHLRLGGVAIDLAFVIVFAAVLLARSLLVRL
jgi:YggT family protein